MKLLFVHAHPDDFEFTAGGTFELWRHKTPGVERRVLICTDGGAGHHAMTRAETARRRIAEQEEAGFLGGFECRFLRDREGRAFREGRLHATTAFIPALWQAIREYEPDYLFCPPIPADPLVGVHLDHLEVAQAVRAVAYLINVPHAFAPEFDLREGHATPVRTPVILNTFDGYMAGGHGHDLAINITGVAEFVADLAWCHQSQLCEWLPWVDRHNIKAPADQADWRDQFRARLNRQRVALGIRQPGLYEVFLVTAWGVVPTLEQLQHDFPDLDPEASRLDRLERRLATWRGAPQAAETATAPVSASDELPAGGDSATLRRRLEIVLGGPPGFITGAKADILADLLAEFGRATLVAELKREWVSRFDTGPDASPSVVRPAD